MSDVDDISEDTFVDAIIRQISTVLQIAINAQLVHFVSFRNNLNAIKKTRGSFSDSNSNFKSSCECLFKASGIIAGLRETASINDDEHHEYLCKIDAQLQSLSTDALLLLADIIQTNPRAGLNLGYEKVSEISWCLIGNCSDQSDPALNKVIDELDYALLAVDLEVEMEVARKKSKQEGIDFTETFISRAATEPLLEGALKNWIDARNLGKQTTPAAKGPDPALGG